MSVTHAHLLDLLAAAIVNLHPHRRIRVAIDGVDGGKTTLADALAPLVSGKGRPVIRASIDHFLNPRSMRYAPAHARYVGGQRLYLADCAPEQHADIVINYDNLDAPKILEWVSAPHRGGRATPDGR